MNPTIMNKFFFTLLLFMTVSSMSLKADDITGSWQGVLKIQNTQLRVVFTIKQNDSTLITTMDSPDQGLLDFQQLEVHTKIIN